MITIPGKIPVTIYPLFWLCAAFLGFMYSGGQLGALLLWVVVIFISVLVHEYGHASTALFFKKKPKIALVALGGMTTYDGDLPLWKQFLIVLNGPLAGLLLAFAAKGCTFLAFIPLFLRIACYLLFYINIFWTLVNLLPILPLDGGQLLRIVLEGFFGFRGIKITLFIGMVLAGILAAVFFTLGAFLIGTVFLLFTFEGYQSWKRSKEITSSDKSSEVKTLLSSAENALMQGNKEEARAAFEEILRYTNQGVAYKTAAQYLGLLYYKEGRKKQAYDMLLNVQDSVRKEPLFLLHELAFLHEDYALVTKLSSQCFQEYPQKEVAVKNAKAFGRLSDPISAGGWVQSAHRLGVDTRDLLKDPAFDLVRKDREFQEFVEHLQ